MAKTFLIQFELTRNGCVQVEADSEAEAKQEAERLWSQGYPSNVYFELEEDDFEMTDIQELE